MLLAFGACDQLAKAFEDVQEEAPGICKKDCAEAIDCEWGEGYYDFGGDKEDSARADAKKQCIAECAWAINYGVYVVEYDDDEIDFVGKVSGSKFEKYQKCLFDLKDCSDDNWGLDIEWDDEDDCEEYNKCVQLLGIDLEYEFEEEEYYGYTYEACVGDGDQSIWW
jgi:hypothetical protein